MSKKTLNAIFLCFFFVVLATKTFSQKQKIDQTQLWFAYLNNLKFSDKWRLLTDIQERQFVLPVGAKGNLIFRSILYHNLGSNWEVGAGLALFFTGPQKVPSTSDLVVPELRPTVDFLYKQKAGQLNINHRYRFEARYFHDVANNALDDGFSFGNYRFRYQLSLDYPLIKNAQKKPVVSARVYDEIFLNAGHKIVSNTFDQNRTYAGFVFTASKSFSFELGYLKWFQETSDGKTYFNRDIYRVGINQTINLSKSKKS
ncbi:MAG: DUF2490 domain-containing protein [Chitinophagaceae bacterium]